MLGVAPTARRSGSRCRRCGGAGRRLRRTRGAAERGEHDLSALAEVAKDTAVRDGERADARRVDGPVADACLQPNILDPAEHERRDFAPALERDHVGTQRLRLPGEDERKTSGSVANCRPWRRAHASPERLELVPTTRHSNARAAPRRDFWSLPRHGSPRAPAYGGRAGRRRIRSCVPRLADRAKANALTLGTGQGS